MARKPKFQAPTGMHDVLPQDQGYYQRIYNVGEKIAKFYGFEKIDTPIVESTDLFIKGTGQTTDIVQKQMFNLRTRGGDSLTLRPEFTPGVVRAYIEHGLFNLPQPLKLYSIGPLFRYERPQAGRFRQFHHFNLEVFGEESSAIDAQIIQIFYNILSQLKLKNLIIKVNSIGDSRCRPYYKKLLVSYLRSRESSLCTNCKRRIRENPLRVLDCKEEKCQPIKAQAPQMIDHLCDECHSHFKEVLEFLDEIELPYHLDPHLVRGLDYYTKTVFEILQESEEGKKVDSLVGGGRYDALVKLLGGKDTPACGGAAGIERIVGLMKLKDAKAPSLTRDRALAPQVFLAQLGSLAKRKSLRLLEDFRKAKIGISESLGRDSLKAQLNRANKIGARYTLILGHKEALEEMIIVRDMRTGRQKIVPLGKVVAEMKKRLKK